MDFATTKKLKRGEKLPKERDKEFERQELKQRMKRESEEREK